MNVLVNITSIVTIMAITTFAHNASTTTTVKIPLSLLIIITTNGSSNN